MTQTDAFLLTLAIEVPVVVAGAHLAGPRRPALRTVALVALGANAFTHPLLWIADAHLVPHMALPLRWGLLEAAVVVAEAAAYAVGAGTGRARGLALSLVANAVSFGAGLLLAPAAALR